MQDNKMFIFTLLLLAHYWTTAKSDCGAPPSVALTCRQNQVDASWSVHGCDYYRCKAYRNCTNGTRPYLSESHGGNCPSTFLFPDIPMDYYNCIVNVHYGYLDDNYNLISSPTTTESCVFNKIELQNDHNRNQTVGKYHEVHCIFYTGKAANSSEVNISWIGPDGVIANDNRITVIPTTSDGHIHTSTLQFSYISEKDENTLYNCTASLFGDHKALSKSFTMSNLTIPKPIVTMTAIGSQTVGDKLSLRCDATIAKGISSNVDFMWNMERGETGQVVKYPLSNTSVLYTNFLNISSLNSTDNNTVYSCQVVINTSLSVNVSDAASLTLNITVASSPTTSSTTMSTSSQTTPSVTQTSSSPTPQSNPTSSSPTPQSNPTASRVAPPDNSQATLVAIILSVILTFVMIVVTFVVYRHKCKRLLLKRVKSQREADDQYKILDIVDNDYSVIGKDEPSTVEYLRVVRSVCSNSQMPKIDEECSSVSSYTDFITNEEMLVCVNGGEASEKQQCKTLKLDKGYYSDTSMSPKRDLSIASTSNTEQLHSSPNGDYIQSSVSPYVDDTIAMQQSSMSPLSDPNESHSSLSQLQSSEDSQMTSVSNNDSLLNQGEYVADSMAMEQCNSSVDVAPVELGYLDYNAAVNQHTTKQAVSYSTDADIDMKIHKSSANSDSFPYIALNEDSTLPFSDQLGSSYNAHNDTKGEDYTVTEVKQYAMNGVYIDYHDSSPVQPSNAELTVNQTLPP